MIANVRCAGHPERTVATGYGRLGTEPATRPCGWSGKRMTSRGVILNLHLPCKNCGGAVEEILFQERSAHERSARFWEEGSGSAPTPSERSGAGEQ